MSTKNGTMKPTASDVTVPSKDEIGVGIQILLAALREFKRCGVAIQASPAVGGDGRALLWLGFPGLELSDVQGPSPKKEVTDESS